MKITKFITLMIVCLLGLQANAQNVTIGPDNGSLVTGQAGGNTDDSGIKRGMASMWRHEQLPLTMTTSDIANLTAAGELADPSCAIDKYNGNLILGAGQTQTFVVVSLPKGYRITGYRLVLQPNVYGNGIVLHQGKDSWNIGQDDHMRFYETPAWSTGSPYPTTGNTHSTQLDCPDQIAVATAADGSIDMYNNNDANRSKEFVIQRTSQTATDMTNQLHFFFARASSQYAVTIKSFEIFFTAGGTFETDVAPATLGASTDYVTSPFTTSKMDIGAVKESNNMYVYDYTGVQDLIAYTHLYQDNAIAGGIPSHVDGPKNIHPVVIDGKGAFAFGSDTYYIESPTTIHTASGWNSPIGYRIVGAKFAYKWGTATEGGSLSTSDVCYIRGNYVINPRNSAQTNSGGYLNDNLDITSTVFAWQIDEFGNIYKEYTAAGGGTYRKYLACFGEGEQRILSLSSAATGHEATWNLRIEPANGNATRHIYYKSDNNNYYYLNWNVIQEGADYHSRCYVTRDYNSNLCYGTTSNSHTTTTPAFTPGEYTLKIYDKTGTQLATDPITVRSSDDEGTYELTGLNNDAVKFEIEVEDGKQALVNVTLEMQALDPYINKMDIVCTDDRKVLSLTQSFTASDFKVSGGKFIFYVPEDYADDLLTFTFSDLYSKYGDNTYYDGTGEGYSRYSFITSEYFVPINGNGNLGLYDGAYSPDAPYTNKVYTSTAGNIRFKFNNAEDLTVTGSGTNRYLQEYPFSVSDYIGSADPDHTSATGQFINCKLQANLEDQKSGTYYVFTADETRYNIAPTTNWQHRYYAFYRMEIELRAKTFTPDLTWRKVYNETCYDSDGNGTDAFDSMWGVKLATTDNGSPVDGYLTYQEIINAINTQIANTSIETPESTQQILYVDGSDLLSMINSSEGSEVITVEDLKKLLAVNNLVFLPENTTSTFDNVAYKTSSGSFRAGNDIVITDKKPFFSPYDIQVDAADYAKYERLITVPQNGQVSYATIMVPFTIAVDANGVHTNEDGSCSFSLNTMQADNCLGQGVDPANDMFVNYEEYAKFNPLITSLSEANKPYMVQVTDAGTVDGSKASFIVIQKGSSIAATPVPSDYTYTGETATGTVSGASYTFTNHASYSGKKIATSEKVFYFAANHYFSTENLKKNGKNYLYVYPFRGYYTYSGGNGANSMMSFFIMCGDYEGASTGIADATKARPDLAVSAGEHSLTFLSTIDQTVTVSNASGMTACRTYLTAGDSKTVHVPAGIYIINGVKIVVK